MSAVISVIAVIGIVFTCWFYFIDKSGPRLLGKDDHEQDGPNAS